VPPATVFVRPHVLREIATFAAAAGPSETGGPLLGTVQRSWDADGVRLIASVLATVPPGPAVRGKATSVALGAGSVGERATSALRWWRTVTGLDLRHLGDWHVHPFRFPLPSDGDRLTAERTRSEITAPLLLAAIAVSTDDRKEELAAQGHVARLTDDRVTQGEIRFHQHLHASGLVPVPIRIEADAIPALPALPWHVADPVRFAAECRLLDAAAFTTAIGPAPGERPGLTLRLRRNGSHPLTVVTGARYPHDAPLLFDGGGRPLGLRGRWSPERFLVDAVEEVTR
jgi:hypothetical protein